MRRLPLGRLAGNLLVFCLIAVAAIGMFWTPADPLALNFGARLAAPGGAHLLGTDEFGRDVLSRLMAGATSSVWISLVTVAVAVPAGTLLGIMAGYTKGWVDRVLTMCNDAMLAFPGILLALGLISIMGANFYGVIFALGLAYMPSVTRVVRGNVFSISEKEFIEASHTMGNSDLYTMLRHVMPNCIGVVSVMATSVFGWALLAESALSFLGLGVPPPAPTWGNMLASGRPFIGQAPWLAIFPGLCISLALLGVNLFGDAVRDRFDPRMRGV